MFVALDTIITERPVWMESYNDAGTLIENDHAGGHKFRVYCKRYPAGATVRLGNNGISTSGNARMYIVAVCPVISLKQADD